MLYAPLLQDALAKAFDVLLEEGDSLLVESPTYTGALAALKSSGARLVGVPVDGDGLCTSELAKILDTWTDGRKPRVRVGASFIVSPMCQSLTPSYAHATRRCCTLFPQVPTLPVVP